MTAIGSRKPRSRSFEKKLERTAYLFILPAAILLIVFCIVPMLGSLWVSTQKMGVDLSKAEFVGLDNYARALSDRRFIQSIGVTLRYTAIEVPLQMVIGVLLSATGGIVQGMSGSPIIQNGRLVGAVTHVLVNDPTRGYGILIENMLEAGA